MSPAEAAGVAGVAPQLVGGLVAGIGAIAASFGVYLILSSRKASAAGPPVPPALPPVLAKLLEIIMDASQNATDISGRLKAVAAALPDAVNAAIAKSEADQSAQSAADFAAIGDGVTAIEGALASIKAIAAPADSAGDQSQPGTGPVGGA